MSLGTRPRAAGDNFLSKQKVEIKEFLTSLVVVYSNEAVVTYRYTETDAEQHSIEIDSSPVFHDNRAISKSLQLELFDWAEFSKQMRYVTKRKPNRRYKRNSCDAIQLVLDFDG